MEKSAELYMLYELMEQVEYTCTALESIRDCVSSPDELQKYDSVLDNNRHVVEKAKTMLESLNRS